MFSIKLSKKLSYYLRIELENKIRKLQTELGDNAFDRVDFNKYSFEELEKLELELTYRKRFEEVGKGVRDWWEAIAVPEKIKGKALNTSIYQEDNEMNESSLSEKLTNYYLNNFTTLTLEEIKESKKQNEKAVKSLVLKIDDYVSKKTNALLHSNAKCNFVENVNISNGIVVIDMKIPKLLGELNIKKFRDDIERNVLERKIHSIEKVDDEKLKISILLSSLDDVKEILIPAELSIFAEFINSKKESDELEFILGVDENGEILIRNLKDYGTLGIFGGAGSGKTHFIKQMLDSLILCKSPEEVKFVIMGEQDYEYDFLNPLYLYKHIDSNSNGEKKKNKIIKTLQKINSDIDKRKQMEDESIKEADLIIILDECQVYLPYENDDWSQEFCSLMDSIILEGPEVGVYTVGTGFGIRPSSKPPYLKEITNSICFKLPTRDALYLGDYHGTFWSSHYGFALCDIKLRELSPRVSLDKRVLVKTLCMSDKVIKTINSTLSL